MTLIEELDHLRTYIMPNVVETGKKLKGCGTTCKKALLDQVDASKKAGLTHSQLFFLMIDPDTKNLQLYRFNYAVRHSEIIKSIILEG